MKFYLYRRSKWRAGWLKIYVTKNAVEWKLALQCMGRFRGVGKKRIVEIYIFSGTLRHFMI